MKKTSNRRRFLKQGILAGLGTLVTSAKASNTCEVPTAGATLTTKDYYGQGPFYTANAPVVGSGKLAADNLTGDRILISGYVIDSNTGNPIPNTEIDVWHADTDGDYDNVGFTLRGKVYSDNKGFYSFESVKPGWYPNGGSYRPSHIHFKITPPNEPTLITQLYFKDDPYLETDAAASIESGRFDAQSRIVELVENGDGVFEGCWNIFFDVEDTVAGLNHQLDKGVVYSVIYQTDLNAIQLYFGVFDDCSNSSLRILSLKGEVVETITLAETASGKHESQYYLSRELSSGVYLAQVILDEHAIIPVKFFVP